MATTVKAPATAKFFTNQSNARRALKKYAATLGVELSTEQANLYIQQEHIEDGGRFFYVESAVTKALTVVADKGATVTVPTDAPAARQTPASTESKVRSEVRNGVRKPIRGKCADVWAACTELHDADTDTPPTLAQIKERAVQMGWNINNATIEFYGWRKFHGFSKK